MVLVGKVWENDMGIVIMYIFIPPLLIHLFLNQDYDDPVRDNFNIFKLNFKYKISKPSMEALEHWRKF